MDALAALISPYLPLVSLLAIFVWWRYLKSYVGKKGENLATKEDIEQITTKVEAIRVSYQGALQTRQEFLTEQNRVLLEFYDTTLLISYDSLSENFEDLPMDEGRSLWEHDRKLLGRMIDLLRQYQRIVVYFGRDEKLHSLAETVLDVVLEIRHIHKAHFGDVRLAFVSHESEFRSGEKSRVVAAAATTAEATTAYWGAVNPLAEKFMAAVQGYVNELNQHLRPGDTPPQSSVMFGDIR